jgi:hypothetical protein
VARLIWRAAGQSPELAVAANNGAGGGSDRAARSSAGDQGEMGIRECATSSGRRLSRPVPSLPPLLAGGTSVRRRRAVRHGTTPNGSGRGGLGARGLGREHVGARAGGTARCASARRRGTASTGWKNFTVPLFERVKLQKVE